MDSKAINSHKDLKVWQESMLLVELIHEISRRFPDEEKFVLVPQLRRCAVSISSNIAEGFGRKGNKELLQFLYIALEQSQNWEPKLKLPTVSNTSTVLMN